MAIILNEEDLKIIKKLELEIAVEIKRICDLNNIKYAIVGGTLLGAVRHGGFIPWDDDIDMAMRHDEYQKFLDCATTQLSDKFEVVNYETNPFFGEPFTKIMYNGTKMREVFVGNAKIPDGVFVDLFSWDSTPNAKLERGIQRFKNYSLRKMILLKSGYDFQKTGIKRIFYSFLKHIPQSKETLVKAYRKNQNRYNKASNSKYVTDLGGNYGYIKETIPRSWVSSYTNIEFEGIMFSTFENYKEVLEHYYGDYMKLPPEEERINKHVCIMLDLSKFGGRVAP